MRVTLSSAQQRWIAIALLILALVALYAVVIAPVWASVSRHEERVTMLRAQAAKLQALGDAAPKFEAAAREMASDPNVQGLAFSGAPGTAVADLQAAVNRAFALSGATVTSGQALERPEAASSIAVQVTVETGIAGLVQALHEIGTARPLLVIESISVREPDAEFAAAAPVGTQPNVVNKLIVEIVASAHTRRGLQ